jgi:hypothetical protein
MAMIVLTEVALCIVLSAAVLAQVMVRRTALKQQVVLARRIGIRKDTRQG